MTVAIPKLRVGDPLRHEALSVFPLFTDTNGGVEYRLSPEALADESVVVEEINEGGSVPDLSVENRGDTRVLFLEGEELVGAKQNRILNLSVLIAARTKTKIPVSCVEQGRWRYKSRRFGSSGSHSPSKLRYAMKRSVTDSTRKKRGHRSDQGEIWNQVACLHACHDVSSGTAAMSDAFDTYHERIAEYRERLKYVEGATGMAVAVGDRMVSIDVFDKPVTCQKVWDRLLSGVVFDALEAGKTDEHVTDDDVERFMESARDFSWEQTQAIGEGEEYRASSDSGDHASALVFDGALVHGSVMTV